MQRPQENPQRVRVLTWDIIKVIVPIILLIVSCTMTLVISTKVEFQELRDSIKHDRDIQEIYNKIITSDIADIKSVLNRKQIP